MWHYNGISLFSRCSDRTEAEEEAEEEGEVDDSHMETLFITILIN